MQTRDIRFTDDQVDVLLDATRRRVRQLEKSIKADSGTYHRALKNKERDLENLKVAAIALDVARAAMRRQAVDAVRQSLGMEPENWAERADRTDSAV